MLHNELPNFAISELVQWLLMERAQMVGVVILIALMVLAIGNDLIKVFTNQF